MDHVLVYRVVCSSSFLLFLCWYTPKKSCRAKLGYWAIMGKEFCFADILFTSYPPCLVVFDFGALTDIHGFLS